MDEMTRTATVPAAPAAWAVRWNPVPDARIRLFCLPHTGGGAAVYRDWANRLAPDVEVVALRLPGRESRIQETPIDRIDDLVPALVDAVTPMLDEPHAWFGHSMGAVVAFEVCRQLRQRALPRPKRLIVSGRRAPHLPAREAPVHAAPVADVVERLEELGGTPPEVLADRPAISSLMPMLRADFAVSETHRYVSAPPLDIPITILGGTDDPMADMGELAAWRQHSTVASPLRIFDGDHFFVHDAADQVLRAIRADLLPTAPRRGEAIRVRSCQTVIVANGRLL